MQPTEFSLLHLLTLLASCGYIALGVLLGVGGLVWTLAHWSRLRATATSSLLVHVPVAIGCVVCALAYVAAYDPAVLKDQAAIALAVVVAMQFGFALCSMAAFPAGADLWRGAGVEPFHTLGRPRGQRWTLPHLGISLAGIVSMTALALVLFGSGLVEVNAQEQFEDVQNALMSSRLGMLCFMVTAAVVEEVLMRLALQGALFRLCRSFDSRGWISIAVSSLIWALGHVGEASPEWVKFLQMNVWGWLQGWLMLRRGWEACAQVHVGSNLLIALLFA